MKPLFIAAFTALVCSICVLLLVSCYAKGSDDVNETPSESNADGTESIDSVENIEGTKVTESTAPCSAQQILDDIYNNVTLKNGSIFLTFGARNTLTAENFTKLIIEDQLKLTAGRYSFIIDPNILSVLRHNTAYGGIGYGQEWVAAINVCIKDNVTGEVSSPAELVFTLFKSEEGDEYLASTAQAVCTSPAEVTG
ncbi:MAG: hypothetical protein ACI4RG_13065 [Huintestinicola sp.]